MEFPLTLRFKVLALAPQIYVTDAAGALQLYVKQKLFKLKEAVHVFSDEAQTHEVATIKADRILDWSANYGFIDADGQTLLGGVGRKGFRSLWRAAYEIFDSERNPVATIREANAWVKVLDGFISELPVIGIFSGYFLHPKYVVMANDGTPLLELQKKAAFLEGRFEIRQLAPQSEEETRRNVLALLMLVLLERKRG
jgi:uncharacterized protein YxjI